MSTGKRYSKAEKKEIMEYRQTHTYLETAEKYSVSQMTLARWSRRYSPDVVKFDRFSGKPEYRILLQVIKYLEGVKVVGVFSDLTDSSALASIADSSISEDLLFMSMIGLLSAASTVSTDFSLGQPGTVVTKSKEGIILIQGIGPTLVIIIIYEGGRDVGEIFSKDMPLITRVGKDIAEKFESK